MIFTCRSISAHILQDGLQRRSGQGRLRGKPEQDYRYTDVVKGDNAKSHLWGSSGNFCWHIGIKYVIFFKSPGHAEFEMSMILIIPAILAKIIEKHM